MIRNTGKRLPSHFFIVVMAIAACGIVYQLLLSTASSYILGDSVRQFSLIIGIFMCSMGLGSYISKFFDKDLTKIFILVEIILSIVGGYSVMTVFFLYTHDLFFIFSVYGITFMIGTLVGLEIPLVIRVIETYLPLKENLAGVLAFDYLGGLIGSIAFPLILLPQLGLIKTALFIGLLNLIALFWLFIKIKEIQLYKIYWIITLIVFSILTVSFWKAESIERTIEQGMYSDKIIFSKKTVYQNLVVTKWKDDWRLYINGSLQFSTVDEHRYHETLIHIPTAILKELPKTALILGGGDGLALREILKYPSVNHITLVDIDHEMTKLFQQHKQLTHLNHNSLADKRVTIINEDGFNYVQNSKKQYDLIIADFPDPKSYMISKLYSVSFYAHIKRILKPDGVFVTQASSPFFTKNVFWCISKTIEQVFPYAYQYRVDIPSFNQWGFVLASHNKLSPERLNLKISGLKYLTTKIARNAFDFPLDETVHLDSIKHNTLINPVIVNYYQNSLELLN